ncbi:Hint domain-containing protein [Acidocella facilis]|nr:Hint domain-containing protein [Acidocella facilis]
MTTTVDVTLSSTLIDELTNNNTASSVYVVYYDNGGPTSGTWTTLLTDGTVVGGTAASISSTLSGESVPVTLPGSFASGKMYILVQSEANGANGPSLSSLITQQSDINAQTAAANHFGYDSVELNLTGTATDAGNLTSVVQYGLSLGMGVSYTSGASASVGYDITGTALETLLAHAGATLSTYSTGPLAGSLASAIPPSNTLDWAGYVTAVSSIASDIEISGFFNGGADAGGTYHNAGYFDYAVSAGTSSGSLVFTLTPQADSQIQGTIYIDAGNLENSIYATDGTATIVSNGSVFTTMNTGANNEWGTVLRQFLVGFDAGYYGTSGVPVNGQLGGSIDLNKSANWDPTYGFGRSLSSAIIAGHTYNGYAAAFASYSNSYGFNYADAETAAYTTGGPLLALAEPGTSIDVSTIDLTVFGATDTPTGYTAPTIANIVSASTYTPVTGTSGNNIVLDFATGNGTNAGVVLADNATIELRLLTSDANNVPTFGDTITLSGSLWQQWDISQSNGTYSASANTSATMATGNLMLDNLPMNSAGGTEWYQVVETNGTESKTFNLYLTAETSAVTNASSITYGTDTINDATLTAGTLDNGNFASGSIVASIVNAQLAESNGTWALQAGTLVTGLGSDITIQDGTITAGTLDGNLVTYVINGTTYTNAGLHDAGVSGTALNNDVFAFGTIAGGSVTAGSVSGYVVTGGTSLNGGQLIEGATLTNATLTAEQVTGGSITAPLTIASGTVNGALVTGGTVTTPPAILNPDYSGQQASAGVDGLGVVSGTSGTSVPQYVNSLTYNLAGSDGTASDPNLVQENTAGTVIAGLSLDAAPVVGTFSGTSFEALAGQTLSGDTLTVSAGSVTTVGSAALNTITTAETLLSFGWAGDDNASGTWTSGTVTGSNSSLWASTYTNKVNGEDAVVIRLTDTANNITQTIITTADADGAWASTATLVNQGTYDVTMQDYQNLGSAGTPVTLGSALTAQSYKLVLVETGTPCFCPGTRIRTPAGETPVEALSIGDLVQTREHGPQPIKWIGKRAYANPFLAANRGVWPVRIEAGALGEGLPARPLIVSPEHAMLLEGHLVPAKHLVNGRNVTLIEAPARVEYLHIELERHEILFAEDAPTESFMDCASRNMFHNADEFAALYPDDTRPQWKFCAPVLEGGRRLAALQRRILARAQRRGNAQGAVQGVLDEATRHLVRGWAWMKDQPQESLELEIFNHETRIGSVLANQFRADLAEAGIGNGWHGFSFTLPRPLPAGQAHLISVRAAGCGTLLSGAPAPIAPRTTLDAAALASLRDALDEARGCSGEGDALLALLLDEVEQLKGQQAAQRHDSGPMRRQRGSQAALPAKRALVIDDAWPRPDRNAGAQAILSHMRALQALGWHVSFLPRTGAAPDGAAQALLAAQGIACLAAPAIASVEEALCRQAGMFELVYLHRVSVAAPYMSLIRHYQPRARVMFSVADLHHLRLGRQGEIQERPELTRAAQRQQAQEFAVMLQADAVLTHSPAEAALLRQAGLEAQKLHLVPWAIKPVKPAMRTDREGLLLVGNFAHEPNLDGLLWFAQAVLPALAGQRLTVVGAGLPHGVAQMLRTQGVELAGAVEDLAPYYARARLALAPLRFGAGIKGKVLEAWAHGLPCVMTPIAAEGLELPPALRAAVAPDAAGLIAAIGTLSQDAGASKAHVAAGRALLRAGFTAKAVESALAKAIAPMTSSVVTINRG